MLIIIDAAGLVRALRSSLDPAIKALLELRRDQLLHDTDGAYDLGDLANWIVMTPGDTIPEIEVVTGFALTPDPPWEWVQDHRGIFEAPIVVDDGGFGIILIVPDIEGVDIVLIDLLRRDAKPQS